MIAAIAVAMAPLRGEHAYIRHLRVLGAWWCLGSSVVDPDLLLRYRLDRQNGDLILEVES